MHLVARAQESPDICKGRGAYGVAVAQEFVSEADEFSARLSLALKAVNMSRSQLSAALGVDKSVVSRWMSGQVTPSSYNLARISNVLAKLRPGFNMTLWTAPRAQFEAALGLSAGSLPPKVAVAAAAPVTPAPAERALDRLTGFRAAWIVSAAVVAVVAIVIAAWLLWRPSPPTGLVAPAHSSADSVAVLPFVNMSGDPAKEYLGDGISEEILNDLANTPSLRVAARTSSFAFKGKTVDIGEIARKLNVRVVLEGSVRQEGDRVRIVAQLINATDGFHIWSSRYDRKLSDVLAVQDEIARAIASALGQRLAKKEPRRIDPVAYQAYLRAQYLFNQRDPSSLRRARDLAGEATSRQRDFADAYALRGHALMLLSHGLSEAQQMIATALKLDPANREALDTQLQIALYNFDWETFYHDAHRLMATARRDALYYNGIGFFYQYSGFPDEALEARRQAAQRDPLHFPYVHNLALAQWHVGKLQDALETDKAALELQPSHMMVLSELCALSAITGDNASARDYSRRLSTIPAPHITWRNYPRVCEIEIAMTTKDAARAAALLDQFDKENWYATGVGLLYARTGNLTGAMPFFDKAYERGEILGLIFAQYDAMTPKSLLNDPRWRALWQRPLLRTWQRYHDRVAQELASTKAQL